MPLDASGSSSSPQRTSLSNVILLALEPSSKLEARYRPVFPSSLINHEHMIRNKDEKGK
jgi:hypothetical protein